MAPKKPVAEPTVDPEQLRALLAIVEGADEGFVGPPEAPRSVTEEERAVIQERAAKERPEPKEGAFRQQAEQLAGVLAQQDPSLADKFFGAAAFGEAQLMKAQEFAFKFRDYAARRTADALRKIPKIGDELAHGLEVSKETVDRWSILARSGAKFLDEKGREVEQLVEDVDPTLFRSQDVPSQLARGLGSTIPFAAISGPAGLAGPVVGPALSMALSGVSGAFQTAIPMYEDVLAKTGNEDLAWAAASAGLGLGATEMFGVGKILAKLDRASAGSLRKAIDDLVFEMSAEGLQEFFQTFGEAVSTGVLTGEEIDVLNELAKARDAGLIGVLIGGGMSAAQQTGQALSEGRLAGRKAGRPEVVRTGEAQTTPKPRPTGAQPRGSVEEPAKVGDEKASLERFRAEGAAAAPEEEKPKGKDAEAPEGPADEEEAAQAIARGETLPLEQLQRFPGAVARASEIVATGQQTAPPSAARPAPGVEGKAQAEPDTAIAAVRAPASTAAAEGVPAPRQETEEEAEAGLKEEVREFGERMERRVARQITPTVARAAEIDPKTGLLNEESDKRYAKHVIREADRRRAAGDDVVAVRLLTDNDNFKAVNDVLGHDVGDKVLVAQGDAWKGAARGTEAKLSRVTGDEFGATLLLSGQADIEALRNRMEAVGQEAIDKEGAGDVGGRKIGVSIGFAIAEPGESFESLNKRAEENRNARKLERGVSQARFSQEQLEAVRPEARRRFEEFQAKREKERARTEVQQRAEAVPGGAFGTEPSVRAAPVSETEAGTEEAPGAPADPLKNQAPEASQPFNPVTIAGTLGVTGDQAVALDALAQAMGIDRSRLRVVRGGKPGKGALLQQKPTWYFSNLTELVHKWQRKGTREQLKAHIAKNRSAREEAEWIELEKWLEDKPSVTRDEVLRFVEGTQVLLNEIVYGKKATKIERKYQSPDDVVLAFQGLEEMPAYDGNARLVWGTEENDERWTYHAFKTGNTYTLTGHGEGPNAYWSIYLATNPAVQGIGNYISFAYSKEAALHVARAHEYEMDEKIAERRRREFETGAEYQRYVLSGGEDYREFILLLPSAHVGGELVTPIHWLGKGFFNNLAHMLTKTREIDGVKTLFLEEVQSDWHMIGRMKGYSTALTVDPDIIANEEEAVAEARQALEDAENAAADAQVDQEAIDEAESAYESAKEEYEQKASDYDDARREFEEKESELESAREQHDEEKLEEAQTLLEDYFDFFYRRSASHTWESLSEHTRDQYRAEFDAARAIYQVPLATASGQILTDEERREWVERSISRAELIEEAGPNEAEIEILENELDDLRDQLDDANREMEDAREAMDSAESDYQSARDAFDADAQRAVRVAVQELRDAEARLAAARTEKTPGVPPAPFEGSSWTRLLLKRALALAAEEGYEAIGWPAGQVIANRYRLERVVARLDWKPDPADSALKRVNIFATNEVTYYVKVDASGKVVDAHQKIKEAKGHHLSDLTGPIYAEQILGSESGWLRPGDMKVGGKWAKSLYDKVMVNVANELGRAFGVKVEQTDTKPFGEIATYTYRLRLSQEAREKIKNEGFPLFQGEKGSVEFTDGGKALIRAMESADVSTGVHELAHIARRWLLDRSVPPHERAGISDQDIEVAEAWAGAENGWTEAAEEKFARGFERYLLEGTAPNVGLKSLFAKFKDWLSRIYTRLAGSDVDIAISDAMRAVYDKIVTRGEINNQVERLDEEKGPTELMAFPGEVLSDVRNALAGVLRLIWARKNQKAIAAGTIVTETAREKAIRKWLDVFRGVKTLQEGVVAAGGTVEDATDVYMQEENRRGVTKTRLAEMKRLFFDPLTKHLRKAGISPEEMGEVAMARAAPDRNALVAPRQPEARRADAALRKGEREFFDELDRLRRQERATLAQLDQETQHELDRIGDEVERAGKDLEEAEADFDRTTRQAEQRLAELKTERKTQGYQKLLDAAETQIAKERARVEARLDKAQRRIEAIREEAAPFQRRLLARLETIREAEPLKAKLRELNRLEIERQVVIDSLIAQGVGSGIPTREAREILEKALSGKRGDGFREAFKLLDALTKATRQGWVRDGLMSQAEVDRLEESQPFYVPMRSDLSEEEEQRAAKRSGARGLDVRGKEFKAALGRRTRADAREVLAYVFAQAELGIMRGEKARVMRSFLNFLRANPEITEGFATINPAQTKRALVNGFVQTIYDPKFRLADNVVFVPEADKGTWIEINKEYQNVADAIKNLGADDAGSFLRFVGTFTRFMGALATRYNPPFILGNVLVDAATAFIQSQEHGMAFAAVVVRDIPKALWTLTKGKFGTQHGSKWDNYRVEWEADGGPISFLDLKSLRDILRGIQKDARAEAKQGTIGALWRQWRTIVHVVDAFADISEGAARFSGYVHAREDLGMSPARAAQFSKNLTVNFERRGDIGAQVNMAYLFFNAGVQSTARVGQALKHPAVKRLILAGMAGAMAWDQLMRQLGGKDADGEDCWDKIPSHIKRHNFVFMIPGDGPCSGKKMVTIKTPYTYDLFQTMAFQVSGVMSGDIKPGKALAETLSAAVETFDPIGGSVEVTDWKSFLHVLSPTATDLFVELGTNRDFTGRAIGPEDYGADDKPPSERFWPDKASNASVAISRWLNEVTGGDEFDAGAISISPHTLDHVVGFLTGGAGRTLAQTYATSSALAQGELPAPRDVPFVSRFVREFSPFTSTSEMHKLQAALGVEKKRAKADKTLLSPALAQVIAKGNNLETYRRKRRKEIEKLEGEERKKAERELDVRIQEWNAEAREVLLSEDR